MEHFISASCEGEKCSVCRAPATHKLGEEIPHDAPCLKCGTYDGPAAGTCNWHLPGGQSRHNLSSYVCCLHFTQVLGQATGCDISQPAVAPGEHVPPAVELYGRAWTLLDMVYEDVSSGVRGYFALQHVTGGQGIQLPAVVQYVEVRKDSRGNDAG